MTLTPWAAFLFLPTARRARSPLRHLLLAGTVVTAKGAVPLARALGSPLCALRSADLSQNALSHPAFSKNLGLALEKNATLTHLDISFGGIKARVCCTPRIASKVGATRWEI